MRLRSFLTYFQTFGTTLPNISAITTSKAFTTRVPVETTEVSAIVEGDRPQQDLPGPFTAITPPSNG